MGTIPIPFKNKRRLCEVVEPSGESTELGPKLTLPESRRISFTVPVGKKVLLVLTDYGDDVIPDGLYRSVMGRKRGDFSVCIDRVTGVIYAAMFRPLPGEDGDLSMTIEPFMLNFRVPEWYLHRLDEVAAQVRPYAFTAADIALWGDVARETGLATIRDELILTINFAEFCLQLWPGPELHREVSAWWESPT